MFNIRSRYLLFIQVSRQKKKEKDSRDGWAPRAVLWLGRWSIFFSGRARAADAADLDGRDARSPPAPTAHRDRRRSRAIKKQFAPNIQYSLQCGCVTDTRPLHVHLYLRTAGFVLLRPPLLPLLRRLLLALALRPGAFHAVDRSSSGGRLCRPRCSRRRHRLRLACPPRREAASEAAREAACRP